MSHEHDKPASFHHSPAEAMQAPHEEFLYVACLHEGTGVDAPDFLAVVDAEDGQVVHETPMPNVGDELHHYGWNRCSSACHGPDRSHLIVPGFRSSRIHIVNVADDPRAPRIEKVIEAEEIVAKTGYTRPHTVHCMPGDNVVVSMLGDADGNGAGGFAVLDAHTFELKGRWVNGPDAEEGFCGAALSSTMWHWHRADGEWAADQVIAVEGVELEGWPFPVPGLITDLVLSMDDRFLYFSDWLHGDLRQYDVSDPANPKLTGQLWLGGLLAKPSDAGRELNGGPQMLQLCYDGRRLYVTNSLHSTWDQQFYPGLRSWLLRVNCLPDGGMEVDRDFFVDLG